MSSVAIRQFVRDKIAADFPAIPLVGLLSESIDKDGLADEWLALEFLTISNQAIALGRPTCNREISNVTVFCVEKSGSGVTTIDAGLLLAEQVANAFRYYTVGKITVNQVGAPETPDSSDGRWLLVSVNLEIKRDYTA